MQQQLPAVVPQLQGQQQQLQFPIFQAPVPPQQGRNGTMHLYKELDLCLRSNCQYQSQCYNVHAPVEELHRALMLRMSSPNQPRSRSRNNSNNNSSNRSFNRSPSVVDEVARALSRSGFRY